VLAGAVQCKDSIQVKMCPRNKGLDLWSKFQFVDVQRVPLAILVGLILCCTQLTRSLEICKSGDTHAGCIPYNCTEDSECQSGSPGPYSRCLREFGQCECFHNNRAGIAVNDSCLPVRTGGDACRSHAECRSIRGPSACLGIEPTNRVGIGICGCQPKDYYDEGLNECLELGKTEGSPCHAQIQCNHPGALGELGVCDTLTSRCKCWDTVRDGEQKAGLVEGKCYYSRGVNESCGLREECVLGYHPRSDCLPHESYRNETVCVCPENERCDEEDSAAARFAENSSSRSGGLIELICKLVFFIILQIIILTI